MITIDTNLNVLILLTDRKRFETCNVVLGDVYKNVKT